MDFWRNQILPRVGGTDGGNSDADLERQQPATSPQTPPQPEPPSRASITPSTTTTTTTPTHTPMQERPRRFSLSRPTLPALLRSRASMALANHQTDSSQALPENDTEVMDSPKTPTTNRYTLTLTNLSSTRLDIPNLRSPTAPSIHSPISPRGRQSPMGMRSPSLRPASGLPRRGTDPLLERVDDDEEEEQGGMVTEDPVVARPTAAVTAERRRTVRFEPQRRPSSGGLSGAGDAPPPLTPQSGREGEATTEEAAEEAAVGRATLWSRVRVTRGGGTRRGEDAEQSRNRTSEEGETEGSDGTRQRQPSSPKRFLFCFPWIKNQRVRNQILTCFVSGLFLLLMLGVYLALSLTKQLTTHQFSILIILVILFATIIFCHALIRLCLYILRPHAYPSVSQVRDEEQMMVGRQHMNHFLAPGGYAIPRRPIRVVLARDEEVDGEVVEQSVKPPAYGLWRESVRVDPDRIYWQRNEEAQESSTGPSSSSSSSSSPPASRDAGARTDSPRPPSYASEDGVDYVIDARPRSMAPTTDVPLSQNPTGVFGPAGR